jgi:hypothetical protein
VGLHADALDAAPRTAPIRSMDEALAAAVRLDRPDSMTFVNYALSA